MAGIGLFDAEPDFDCSLRGFWAGGQAEGAPLVFADVLRQRYGLWFTRGPGIGIGDDVAAGLAGEGGEAARFAQDPGVVGEVVDGRFRIHIVEQVDAVDAAIEEGGCGAAHGFERILLIGLFGGVGTKQQFESGGEGDVGSVQQGSPLLYRHVRFDGCPERCDDEEIDEAAAGPGGGIHAETQRRFGS